jgi:hypothetical protein
MVIVVLLGVQDAAIAPGVLPETMQIAASKFDKPRHMISPI